MNASEFVFELGLRPGCLENYLYPDAFPSPPNNLFAQTPLGDNELSPSFIDKKRLINEQGWCYYLAEISVRRIVDETLNLLYSYGPEHWMENPGYLIRQYHECEKQVSSWYVNFRWYSPWEIVTNMPSQASAYPGSRPIR